MKLDARLILLAGALALAACSPKAEAPVAAERAADAPIIPSNPFFGKCRIRRSRARL